MSKPKQKKSAKLAPRPKIGYLEWREHFGEPHPFLFGDRVRNGDKLLWASLGDEKLVSGKLSVGSRTVLFLRDDVSSCATPHPVTVFDRFAWPKSEDHPFVPVPDLVVQVNLVPHGFQADYFTDGKAVYTECRDFDGSHRISKLRTSLLEALSEAVDKWRAKL